MNDHTQQQNLLQQKKKSTSDLLSKTFTQTQMKDAGRYLK